MFIVLSLVVTASMLLAACQPAPTPTVAVKTQAPAAQPTAVPPTAVPPTKAPEPTKAPAATVAPTKAPEPTKAPAGAKLEAPNCTYGGTMKAIEVVDKYTVKFTFCVPEVAFLGKIALAGYGILDKDFLAKTGGDTAKINPKPVGTGPYMIKEYQRGNQIIFEPNPNYWGGKVKNTQLIFKWNKEAAARLLELKSGNVDIIDNPGTDDLKGIAADTKLKLYNRPTPNILYMGMNNTIKPFDNEKVRQAFSIGLDRERIVKNFYPPGSLVAQQAVPPTVKPGYTDGLNWPKYDKAAALKLLQEANFDFKQDRKSVV